MIDIKEFIEDCIDRKEEEMKRVSASIWEYAEGGYQEYQSAGLLCRTLEEEGFTVTENLADIETAFKGVWGSGHPVVGLLGEFDSLPGLSQKAGYPVHEPLVPEGRGHGCGHNLLGTGCLAAAIAIKEYLRAAGKPGTVIFFGTPAEEIGSGKTFMAREGVFDGVDFFYTWHPGTTNEAANCHMVANYSRIYEFKGVTAHAGGSPHLGRSALDSVELMNVGVNYLREHVIQEARIHYAYLDAGGTAPNVVQDHAVIKYIIRAPYIWQLNEITQRIDNIARGAAMMCETEVTYKTESAYSNYIPNEVLAKVMTDAMISIGAPKWTDEDYELAKKFADSVSENCKSDARQQLLRYFGKEKLEEKLDHPLDDAIHPYDPDHRIIVTGSTDVGDVGYVAPTVMASAATAAFGTPGHSWQITGQANSSIGTKGMLFAAKAMALASVLVMESPETLKAAKAEFMTRNNGIYDCPLEKGIAAPKFIS